MKRISSILLHLAPIASLLYTPIAFAQSIPRETIIVTADGKPRDLENVPAAIARLDGNSIVDTHAIRIGEVLAAVPGTYFAGLNGPREIAQIRQPLAFDNRTLFLEDGVPLQSSIFFDQSALAYSLALTAPQAIEVLRGPGTALYGSDAFSGVVNIITRSAPSATEAEARARYGGFGLFDVAGDFGGPIANNQSVRLSASYSGEDGFRDETAFDRIQFLAKHLFEHDDVEVDSLITWTRYQSESATAISFADFLNGSRASGLSPRIDPRAAEEIGTYFRAQSKIAVRASDNISIEVTPYLRQQEIGATATFQPATAPRTDALVGTFGIISRAYFDHDENSHTLIGLDLELTDFSRFTFQDAPDTVVFGNLFRQGVQFDYDVSYRGLSPYIQHEQRLGPLSVQLGLRYDNLRYEFDNQLTEIPGDARLQVADRNDHFTALSPKAGLVLDLDQNNILFARYARGFRIPRESDLYELEDGQDSFQLVPEKIDSSEIGWRFSNGWIRTELVGYWAVSRDGIITDVQTAAGNISINAGSSRFAGIEASANADLGHGLSMNASFAFQDFRFRQRAADGPDPFDGNLISEAPRTLGQVSFFWTPKFHDRLTTSLRLRHIGKWALNDANTLFTDNEFILTAFAKYQLAQNLFIDLRVENLTDTRYPVFADAPAFAPAGRARPGTPRTISGGISLKY